MVRSCNISNYLHSTFLVQTSSLQVNVSRFETKSAILLFGPPNERFITLIAWKISDKQANYEIKSSFSKSSLNLWVFSLKKYQQFKPKFKDSPGHIPEGQPTNLREEKETLMCRTEVFTESCKKPRIRS